MSQPTSTVELGPTVSPDAVFDALFARQDADAPVANERSHERRPWVTSLTVWVREREWESPREIQVTTGDISRGGLSFTHSQFLYARTLIYTRFDALPGSPVVVGVVANCTYLAEGQHRIGVRFLRSVHQNEN